MEYKSARHGSVPKRKLGSKNKQYHRVNVVHGVTGQIGPSSAKHVGVASEQEREHAAVKKSKGGRINVDPGRQWTQNRLTKKPAALGTTGGNGQLSMGLVAAIADIERENVCAGPKPVQQSVVAIRIRLNTRNSVSPRARKSLLVTGIPGVNGLNWTKPAVIQRELGTGFVNAEIKKALLKTVEVGTVWTCKRSNVTPVPLRKNHLPLRKNHCLLWKNNCLLWKNRCPTMKKAQLSQNGHCRETMVLIFHP